MTDYADIVAKNLITLRKAQGLTQQDFAKIFNYSDKTISKWELGYAIPNVETLKQIADYYGVTVDYFLISHEEVIDTKARFITRKTRRIMLMALFNLTFLSVSATIYSAIVTMGSHMSFWPVFIWGIAACGLFDSFATNAWFKHTWAPYVATSVTIWSILVAIYFTILINNESYNFWYLFFIGLPAQLATLLILKITHSSTRD